MFNRAVKSLSLTAILLFVTSHVHEASVARVEQPNLASPEINIKSVEFFAWHHKGAKKEYVKLERWLASSSPPSFDIVCEIENAGMLANDYVVLTHGEFIVAPKDEYSEADLGRLKDEVSWGQVTTMNDIKMEVVSHLLPKETRRVKIRGLNVGRVAKDFSGSDESLWPWLLRMNVRVETRDGVSLAKGQAILPLVPARFDIRRRVINSSQR